MKLNIYTYTDNIKKTVVFTAVKPDILEADKAYQEATGQNVIKQSYVSVQIEPVAN